MNYTGTNSIKSRHVSNLSYSQEYLRKCRCEDLPNNIKASKIILRLPFTLPDNQHRHAPIIKSRLQRPSKRGLPALTLSDINNSELYDPPVYTNTHSRIVNSIYILPHRYGVECNDLHRIRISSKSKPKLRRLILSVNHNSSIT